MNTNAILCFAYPLMNGNTIFSNHAGLGYSKLLGFGDWENSFIGKQWTGVGTARLRALDFQISIYMWRNITGKTVVG